MANSDKDTKRVFISYSHQDEHWKEKLHTHLKVLVQQNRLSVWEDQQIAAGEDWYPAIEKALNSAQVAILLISKDFLTSKFIQGEEVPVLLKRRKEKGLTVIPLILNPCTWEAIPWLASIQGRPKDHKPLSNLSKIKREQFFADFAMEILDLVDQQPIDEPIDEQDDPGFSQQEFHELQEQRTIYLKYLTDTYKYLDFKGIDSIAEAVTGSSGITLESVYVPLRARFETQDAETRLRLGGRLYRDSKVIAVPEIAKQDQENIRAEQTTLSIEQWMEFEPALVILGDPGCGKSTTLKRFALSLAQRLDGPLPILIPLNAYGKRLEKGVISFEEFISEYFNSKRAQLDRNKLRILFAQSLKQNRAVVLLDGLDEVGLNRGPLVAQIESFVRAWIPEYPIREKYNDKDSYEFSPRQKQHNNSNRIVITSRIVGYRDYPLTDFRWQIVSINDWNREEIESFFSGFTLACELAWKGRENLQDVQIQASHEQQSLLRVIDANPGIRRLVGNPLLASLLALIKRQGVTLPDRRVELYKLYMETMLRSWNRARSLDKQPIGPEIDFSPTQRLLAKLALHLRQTNPQGGLIEESAMRDYLLKYFQDDGYTRKEADEQTKGFLDSVHKYSNLLVEKGYRQYGFIHLAFEEYLAGFGLALEREAELLKLFSTNLQQPEQWRETLLLAIGVMALVNNNTDKANTVLESLLQSVEPQRILFVGAALNDVGATVLGNRMAKKIQQSLLALGQDIKQTLSVRRRAGLLLGDSGWLPTDLDGMIFIPKGSFLYGEEKTHTEIAHEYWIGKYPVTNAQYKRFVKAGGYRNQKYWTVQGWHKRDEKDWQQPNNWDDSEWANPLSPVVGINWYEAQAYCNWLLTQLSDQAETMGLKQKISENYIVRMPTNEEWERAARGIDGNEFPWGNNFNAEYVNCSDSWVKGSEGMGTTAVLLFPEGASPDGLYDCAGNIWEGTSSLDKNELPYFCGGSWDDPFDFVRCTVRDWISPSERDNGLGFRIVIGPPL